MVVQPRLTSNCGKFAIIKMRIVDRFPEAQRTERVVKLCVLGAFAVNSELSALAFNPNSYIYPRNQRMN